MRCVDRITQRLVLGVVAACSANAAVIQGVVLDAGSREGIGRVSVRGCGPTAAVTDSAGRFRLDSPAGACVLHVAAVGYRPLSIKVEDLREGGNWR